MIDLHSHTIESDGTYTPWELVEAAMGVGLEALGITDHDTFAGYDQAGPLARERGFDLVCGIELSTRASYGRGRKTVHMLAYFLNGGPSAGFRAWVASLLASRRERNIRLIRSLNEHGVEISLGEVEKLGRSLTGRPHFARVLLKKGYVGSIEEAFRRYLAESAPSYVERDSPAIEAAIREVAAGGGISVLAHPVRLGFRRHEEEERFIGELKEKGLRGIEVWHSDHSAADTSRYMGISERLGLLRTGGTDFHGGNKPGLALGTGRDGNVQVGREVLEELRAAGDARPAQ
jgi:predicted metal-dependent phosphoesterase TrpH